MSFDNCDSGGGETADGSFEFVIDSISGNLDSGEVVLSVAMIVSNLTLTDGSGTGIYRWQGQRRNRHQPTTTVFDHRIG